MKEININIRVEHYQLDELNTADRELVERALEATNGAYAPYSNFYVGAALRLADGTIVTGANQEKQHSHQARAPSAQPSSQHRQTIPTSPFRHSLSRHATQADCSTSQ